MNNRIKIMKKSYFSKEETVPMELASCCIIKTINNLLIESQVPPNIMYEIDTTIFSFGKNYQEYKKLKIAFIKAACQFIEQNLYKTGE